jgi:amino acid adenylation domain-containing protein
MKAVRHVAAAVEPAGVTIADRVASFARRSPELPAIVDGDAQLTYAELDASGTRLAHALAAVGPGAQPGNVCLLFESRIGAVQAIVGTARSGHAYVPLDAADPAERLRFVVEDCAPVAILTEPSLVERARNVAPRGVPVVDLCDVPRKTGGFLPAVGGDATAYLYYTSGSTGRPKGVRQTHDNLRFFVDAYGRSVGIGEGDRITMMYAVSFAAGIGGIYRAVALGGTLCAYDLARSGIDGLPAWLDRERISMLHTFPMIFREVARRLAPGRVLPHLDVVHLGGESLYAGDVDLFRAHTLPHCRLVHQLSATEIGVIAQNVIDHRIAMPASAVIPVGKPLPGVRIEIHRTDGSPAGVDEAGEIVACSRHVSPGYWRRPDLDAAAFAADPVDPAGRCYRTGDSGRIDAEGNLHFLGRAGSRVKIRGHTVDVAEIEAALASCPGVARAAVAPEADPADAKAQRLVAWIEARDDASRSASTIARHLSTRLPLHMLPASIRFVAALPLTPGGKLDRRQLASLDVLPSGDAHLVAPRDAVEAAVAHVFQALLKRESVSADDDFFLSGGDSLLAAELAARLADAFGVRAGPFHKDATIAGIAAEIRRERNATQSAPLSRTQPMLVRLWPHGRQIPLFLVHGRYGQAFVSPPFMRLLGNEQPVWVFQARGLDGVSEPHATIEAMAQDYVAALRSVRPRGPYFIGGLCIGGFIAAAMAQALRSAGEDVLPLLLFDPPGRALAGANGEADPGYLAGKMRARDAAGKLLGPMSEPGRLDASLKTAKALDAAIARYRPQPYDGAVYVLSSRSRIRGADPLDLRSVFTGRFKRYEVGESHRHALDPRNPVFAGTLSRCLELIRASARAA